MLFRSREGNGLDAMLETVLKQSPEAAAVDLRDGCIEMECHPEYCGWLSDSAEDRQPGLRLKDILPLLKDNEPVFRVMRRRSSPYRWKICVC